MTGYHGASAIISPCGRYRYSLKREWSYGPRMLFVMLNPSTADANIDDPTIKRCIGFARREGCGSVEVVNLFAWRATDPRDLVAARKRGEDIVGPENDLAITTGRLNAAVVVVAWGAHPFARDRGAHVLRHATDGALCLGITKDGHPRHPLYVPGNAAFFTFRAPT